MLRHHPGAHGDWYDHAGVLAALGAVDAHGVGVRQFVEFAEFVVDCSSPSVCTVIVCSLGFEYPVGAFVVIVAHLDDCVSDPEHSATGSALMLALTGRVDRVGHRTWQPISTPPAADRTQRRG